MITCRRVTELLTDDAEGALAPLRRAQVALHLKICGHCRAHRAQFRATVGLLRALPREAPPEDLLRVLLDRLPPKR